MRKKLLGSLAALVAGGGLAWGQSPPQPLPILPPAPTSGAVVPAMAYGYGPGGIQPVGYMPGGMPGSAFVGMAPPGEAIGPPGGMPPGAMPPGAMPQGAMPPGAMPPGAMPGGDMPYGGGMPYPYGGDCYGGADCGTATASAAERMFVKVEYLLWWVKPGPVPIPIITTGSPIGGAIVPASTTQVIFGGDDVNFKGNSGFHVETGCWWDCNHRLGLDLQGFMLEKRSHIASAISDANGFPVIGRPFIEAITGTPSVVNVAFPGFENGLIGATYSTQTWGAEVNAMANLFRSDPCHKCGVVFNLLGGARYMALEETLDITSISSVIGTGPNGVPTQNTIPFGGVLFQAPATVGMNDHFYTKTNFYGGQVGFQMEMRRKCITVDLGGKLGVGMVHEILDINGASALAKNGVTAQAVQPGGLLASVTNIGRSSDDRFTLLPECNINLGWQICSGIKASIGYNGLYLQHALRAGDQLNPVVNSTLIPTSQVFGVPFGPLQPQRVFNDSTFWTQGITFSLAFKY